MKNEEILKICGEHWRKIQKLGKKTPNLAGEFEKLMFEFINQCFGSSFGVYQNKVHYQNPGGIKCLNGKTPDIVITSQDTKGLNSIVDIGIDEIKVIIELTSAEKHKIAKKTWKEDVLKYKLIRKCLHDNNVSLGTISLFTIKPTRLNTSGNSHLKPEELFLNRMTFAAFLKPPKPKNEPWWFWVSKTPLTESMKIPCDPGCRFNEKCLDTKLERFRSPICCLYAFINEILNKNSGFTFQSFSDDQYKKLFPEFNNVNNSLYGNSDPSMYAATSANVLVMMFYPDTSQEKPYEEN